MTRSLSSSKGGQIMNYTTVILVLFVFAVTSIIGVYIVTEFMSEFAATSFYTDDVMYAGETILFWLQLYDYLTVFLMFSLLVAVGVWSYQLPTRPMFFIVTIVMASFLGVVSYFFNYIFAQIVSQVFFASTLLLFPKTVLICTNFHWISLVALVIGSVTLYAKRDNPLPGGFS